MILLELKKVELVLQTTNTINLQFLKKSELKLQN